MIYILERRIKQYNSFSDGREDLDRAGREETRCRRHMKGPSGMMMAHDSSFFSSSSPSRWYLICPYSSPTVTLLGRQRHDVEHRAPRVWSGTIVLDHQGFKFRPEPVRIPRLPVKPVRTGSGLIRYKPVQIQNLNLNSKKWKILKKFLKILQDATNLMVSNFLKNSFI